MSGLDEMHVHPFQPPAKWVDVPMCAVCDGYEEDPLHSAPCTVCDGEGSWERADGGEPDFDCPNCSGTGQVVVTAVSGENGS